MTKSMTAYGRCSRKSPFGKWVVEIHSLNRRGLDIYLHLPPQLLCYDIEVRKMISDSLQRGQVTVRITLQPEEIGHIYSEKYYQALQGLKTTWDGFAKQLGYTEEEITLPFLVGQIAQVLPSQSSLESPEVLSFLQEAVQSAVQDLMIMKREEGKELEKDIFARLQMLKTGIEFIVQNSSQATEKYRQRLKEKLQEFSGIADHEEKIAREVALLAEKLDTTEEITRLSSHISQFFKYLESKEESIGRTLDFLSQEMHREVNTIAAKCADKEISSLVVRMKGEVEKIREQIQNIE